MSRWFVLLVLLLPSLLSAQIVTDTVRITVEGDLAYVRIQLPDTTTSINDSIQYTALAVDSEGDPVTVLLTWISTNPTAVQVDSETGLAVCIGKGGSSIVVRAEKIGALLLASFRDGVLNFSGYDTIAEGETLQYCAWLVDEDNFLLACDPCEPFCPPGFLPRPEPPISLFALVPRQRRLFVSSSTD